MSAFQVIGRALILMATILFVALLFSGQFMLTETTFEEVVTDHNHRESLRSEMAPFFDQSFNWSFQIASEIESAIDGVNQSFRDQQQWDKVIYTKYTFSLVKSSSIGWVVQYSVELFWLLLMLLVLGSLLQIIPQLVTLGKPGIKNNGVFQDGLKSRGLFGMSLGLFLILFYVLLYWFPQYITNWVLIVDDLSLWMSGSPASQWFLYGTLYTLAILIMGVRMLIRYRHSNYHLIRTSSVMFFQTAFAFVIPHVLMTLSLPAVDLKNIWPLDYSFFFDYRLDGMVASGTVGYFFLGWGLVLFVIGVPLFTYLYGKRWYCSWVCGCGGLAETAGDPFRHLSDKRLVAWQVERYMIHGVLVFAVVMTAAVLYSYFTNQYDLVRVAGWSISSYDVRGWYGFLIGSAFAGVIGTGFYPLMGNRVWCRLGCPLAAYLGIVQRFKSRFRITTNGGQCISCGNCSTYCEMGIDVRSYAQRGQNIVRSSCVGCGVCASVCPRGVLKLENGSDTGSTRTEAPAILLGNDGARLNL